MHLLVHSMGTTLWIERCVPSTVCEQALAREGGDSVDAPIRTPPGDSAVRRCDLALCPPPVDSLWTTRGRHRLRCGVLEPPMCILEDDSRDDPAPCTCPPPGWPGRPPAVDTPERPLTRPDDAIPTASTTAMTNPREMEGEVSPAHIWVRPARNDPASPAGADSRTVVPRRASGGSLSPLPPQAACSRTAGVCRRCGHGPRAGGHLRGASGSVRRGAAEWWPERWKVDEVPGRARRPG